jgi:hypothetical protein
MGLAPINYKISEEQLNKYHLCSVDNEMLTTGYIEDHYVAKTLFPSRIYGIYYIEDIGIIYRGSPAHKQIVDKFKELNNPKEKEVENLDYNPCKDSIVNSILDSKDKVIKKEVSDWSKIIYYSIKKDTMQIEIIYRPKEEFKSEESWSYFFTYKSGKCFIIMGEYKDNKLNNSTYIKIKNLCLNEK